MKSFDKWLFQKVAEEKKEVPQVVHTAAQEALRHLPEPEVKVRRFPLYAKALGTVASVVFLLLVVLPNVSTAYAEAVQKLPVVGRVIEVVNFRNYVYDKDSHQLQLRVPQVQGNSEAGSYVNQEIDALTQTLLQSFYKNLEQGEGKSCHSVQIDYKVLTNTSRWFTLQLQVTEIVANTGHYDVYYHIDKTQDKMVFLGDLFQSPAYKTAIEAEVRRQMQAQMQADENKTYWLDSREDVESCISIDEKTNFYWNDEAELVIVFAQYEVGPGSMGMPEFVIPKAVYTPYLKENIRQMVK